MTERCSNGPLPRRSRNIRSTWRLPTSTRSRDGGMMRIARKVPASVVRTVRGIRPARRSAVTVTKRSKRRRAPSTNGVFGDRRMASVVPPQSADRDDRLARLLAALTDQARQGRPPDVDAVAAQHPDLAAELRELWAAARFAD